MGITNKFTGKTFQAAQLTHERVPTERVEVQKSAKIGLSNSIFYVKKRPNLSKKIFIEEYQFRTTFFVKYIF